LLLLLLPLLLLLLHVCIAAATFPPDVPGVKLLPSQKLWIQQKQT